MFAIVSLICFSRASYPFNVSLTASHSAISASALPSNSTVPSGFAYNEATCGAVSTVSLGKRCSSIASQNTSTCSIICPIASSTRTTSCMPNRMCLSSTTKVTFSVSVQCICACACHHHAVGNSCPKAQRLFVFASTTTFRSPPMPRASSVAIIRPFKYITSGVTNGISNSFCACCINAGSSTLPRVIASLGSFTTTDCNLRTAKSVTVSYSLAPITMLTSLLPTMHLLL